MVSACLIATTVKWDKVQDDTLSPEDNEGIEVTEEIGKCEL